MLRPTILAVAVAALAIGGCSTASSPQNHAGSPPTAATPAAVGAPTTITATPAAVKKSQHSRVIPTATPLSPATIAQLPPGAGGSIATAQAIPAAPASAAMPVATQITPSGVATPGVGVQVAPLAGAGGGNSAAAAPAPSPAYAAPPRHAAKIRRVGLPNGLVIDRDDVIDVRLKKPVKIASLSVDDTFTVEVANDLPISSNSDVGLPPGTEIVARVTAIEDSPDRMVTVVFDRIIAPNGQVYPFLGGMSTSGGGGSPRWLQRQIDDGRDRASANEGLAGMTAWAGMGDHPILTAIAIPTVSLLTRKVMSARNAVRQQKAEAKSALSFITDDLPAARFSVRAARTFHY